MILKNISEAKAQLSALIEAVQGGEVVVFSKAGKPVAKLTKFEGLVEPRKLGQLEGKIRIEGDFKGSLTDELATAFGMEPGRSHWK